MTEKIKKWSYRILLLAGMAGFIFHGMKDHPLLVLGLLALIINALARPLGLPDFIKLLLPYSAGILVLPMKLFYWDRFEFYARVELLLWLCFLYSLFLVFAHLNLLKKILDAFNRWSIKKRLILIFLVVEILFICAAYVIVDRGVQLGGDEPHYMAVSQSLIKDGDLNVFDQYFRKGFQEFIDVDKLPAHGAFGKGYKKMYSTHLPGVSLTLAPFLMLDLPLPLLYFLIRAYLGLFAALLAVLVYLFALKLWKKPNLSLFLTSVLVLTSPVFFLSIHIFPELQALLLILSALYFLLFPGERLYAKTLLAGFLLGAAIFWGLKYLIFLVIMIPGFMIYFLRKKEPRRILLLAVFPILFLLLFFYYLYFAYGNFSPMSVYTGMMSEEQARQYYSKAGAIPLKNRVETLLGYLFDQRDGLLLYNPFYFFAFPGLLIAFRKIKNYWPHLLVSMGGFLYILYHGYSTVRAGYCPQGRYLVPVMWVFLLLAVIYYRETQNYLAGKLFFLLPIYSFFVVIYQVFHPFTLYQPATHDNISRPGLMFQQWGNLFVDPSRFLPSFIKVDTNFTYLVNLVFLVLFVLLIVLAMKKTRVFKLNWLPLSLFILIFVAFVLPPRVGLYNPTLVREQGDFPYWIYRESRYTAEANRKVITLKENTPKTITLGALKKAEALAINIVNKGDTISQVDVYLFDKIIGKMKIFHRIAGRIHISSPVYKRHKKRYYYNITLVPHLAPGEVPHLETEIYPVK